MLLDRNDLINYVKNCKKIDELKEKSFELTDTIKVVEEFLETSKCSTIINTSISMGLKDCELELIAVKLELNALEKKILHFEYLNLIRE